MVPITQLLPFPQLLTKFILAHEMPDQLLMFLRTHVASYRMFILPTMKFLGSKIYQTDGQFFIYRYLH